MMLKMSFLNFICSISSELSIVYWTGASDFFLFFSENKLLFGGASSC